MEVIASGGSKRLKPIVVTALVAALLAVAVCAGCGLQTDEANKILTQANKQQEEAEVILARIKGFPAEWQATFAESANPSQVAKARELVKAREADVEAFDQALAAWDKSYVAIQKLNVDDKVKKYVALKRAEIKSYQDYVAQFLRPIIKGYAGLAEQVALGRPDAEREKSAADIAALVRESGNKLEECQTAAKKADDYFQQNKLGE